MFTQGEFCHGEFIIVNKHLLKDLVKEGLWNDEMRQRIMAENGSIQNIESVPQRIKDLYKTAWEISQKAIIDMAADRGALHLPITVFKYLYGKC